MPRTIARVIAIAGVALFISGAASARIGTISPTDYRLAAAVTTEVPLEPIPLAPPNPPLIVPPALPPVVPPPAQPQRKEPVAPGAPSGAKESTRPALKPAPAESRTPEEASARAADPKDPSGALIIKPPLGKDTTAAPH